MPTDTAAPLYKAQERIFPKRVEGRYRNLKWITMVVTLGIYYLVPFLRFDRGPNLPDQAVLIDMERGRAYWFWIEIWPQEVYIFTSILIFAAVALFFVTSLFGRVWCGYYCFQTVWTDLFVWVERIFQGDRNARKKLADGPWSFEKIRKLGATHLVWLLIAWCTAGSFVLYFNDAPTLVQQFLDFEVSTTVLVFVIGLTFSTYLMAGFAREQVCTYMCPYARFQSAMFDKDTLIIGYDAGRGEPRGKLKHEASPEELGDCIDCSLCVQVCPMGIDIRDGLQMECIACGLCADACDGVMEKIDKPLGLVGYDTEARQEIRDRRRAQGALEDTSGEMPPLRLLRPRTLIYAGFLALVAVVTLWALTNRSALAITAIHDRNPVYVTLSSGDIRNGFDLKILNKTHFAEAYSIEVEGLDGARIEYQAADLDTEGRLLVAADSVAKVRAFLIAPNPPGGEQRIRFRLEAQSSGEVATYSSNFISP